MANKDLILNDLVKYSMENELDRDQFKKLMVKSGAFDTQDIMNADKISEGIGLKSMTQTQDPSDYLAGYQPTSVDEAIKLSEYQKKQKPATASDIELSATSKSNLKESISANENLIRQAKEYRDIIAEKGFSSSLADPETLGKVESLRSSMLTEIKKAETLGTLDAGLLEFSREIFGVKPEIGIGKDKSLNLFGRKSKQAISTMDNFIKERQEKNEMAMKDLGLTQSDQAAAEPAGPSPEEIKSQLIEKMQYAMDHPDDPLSAQYIDAFENDKIDLTTGKIKDEFREKTEAEKMVEAKMEAAGMFKEPGPEVEQRIEGEVEREKKGFFETARESRAKGEEIDVAIEESEAKTAELEPLTQRLQEIGRVRNYERALENPDEPGAKRFLEGLTDEQKARIEEMQKEDPAKLEEERQQLTQQIKTGTASAMEAASKIGERATEQEEIIASSKLAEAGMDIAEAGEGVVEAGVEAAGTVKEAFGREQDPVSTGIQTVGALGKFIGETGGEVVTAGAKLALSEETEREIGEAATATVNEILKTDIGQRGVALAQQGGEDWEAFREEHPTIAANLEGVAGIVEGVATVGTGGVAGSVAKKGVTKTGKALKEGVETGKVIGGKAAKDVAAKTKAVTKKAAEKIKRKDTIADIEEMISPKLTTKEVAKASKEGRVTRGKESKIFGKRQDVIEHGEDVKRVAQTISSKIKNAHKLDDQGLLKASKSEITKIVDKIKPEMEGVSLKASTLKDKISKWDKIKTKQVDDADFTAFGGKTLQRNFDNVLKEVKKSTKDTKGKFRKKNLNDLWELRKKYDRSVPDRIKNADKMSDSRAQYQKDIWLENRRILNDIINDTADELGVNSRKSFSEMSDFEKAIQNISMKTKLAKETGGVVGEAKKRATGVALGAAGTALGIQTLQ